MRSAERARFNALLERVLDSLPERYRARLEEAPLVVEDRPSPELIAQLGLEEEELLCGLHSGLSLTERSVEQSVDLPPVMHLFREDIIDHAGGWEEPDAVLREIRVTLLHEMGHHFGLEEEDLRRLGYE